MTNKRPFREAPRPNYDYDVKQLTREYERSLKSIQADLNSLFLTDFERAQITAVELNIRQTLQDLRKYGNEWAQVTITKSASEGVASTIYSLGLTETYAEALKIARFNSLNKPLIEAIVADTQADLLAVTQNVERRTRAAVRQATADVLRAKATSGVNGVQSLQQALTKDIRTRLGNAANSAIVDSAGRRWKLKTYTEMVARTKMSEAHREATINEGIAEGTGYGIVSRHYGSCPRCSPWEGQIISISSETAGEYPSMEDARAGGLFHPQCSHILNLIARLDRLPEDLRQLNGI